MSEKIQEIEDILQKWNAGGKGADRDPRRTHRSVMPGGDAAVTEAGDDVILIIPPPATPAPVVPTPEPDDPDTPGAHGWRSLAGEFDPVTGEVRDPGPPYQPIAEVGRGGMGVVFRARQSGLEREIALKRAQKQDPASRTMFVAEAQVTAVLDHPNIVPVHDLVLDPEGRLCLVMKMLRGRSWSSILHPVTPEDEAAAAGYTLDRHLDVLANISQAVAYAHNHGIVHCDLKPDNVMIGSFGEIMVMDWGCAVSFREGEAPGTHFVRTKSSIKTPFGTPVYLPPELAAGHGSRIGPWTDVFLLGAILLEILTGSPPNVAATMRLVLQKAIQCDPPGFQKDVPAGLAEVCLKAMAAHAPMRFADAREFRKALLHYFETRESLRVSKRATELVERCERPVASISKEDTRELYLDYAEAIAGFQNARMLWKDNVDARDGESRARRDVARLALRHGDLGLAEAHVRRLPEGDPEAGSIQAELFDARAIRGRAESQAVLTRRLVGVSLLIIAIVTFGGVVAVDRARRRAVEAATLAERSLEEVKRLADIQLLTELEQQDTRLWPAVPAKAPGMKDWLEEARGLIGRLGTHRAKLDRLRSSALDPAAVSPRFEKRELQWENDTLVEVVAGLEKLSATSIPAMQLRLEAAQVLEDRTIRQAASAWEEVRDAIRRSPRHPGLELVPQLGLIPLGADPVSGLFEFAHLQSGTPVTRGADGRLVMGESSGVVLVLIPGGTARIGAEPGEAGPHRDPGARDIERPVHEVTLDPYFLSKYELTQGQWVRIAGHNPSAYPPGHAIGDQVVTSRHPAEQVRHEEAVRMMARLGLTLPTEVQWEHAARAGTSTVYWTGNGSESLAGFLNIADSYARKHGGPESWRYEDFLDDGHLVHAPVGSFRANPFGLHDIAGNVWEWCLDRHGSYELPAVPGTGERRAPPGAPPLFRGGGFRASVAHARCADRYGLYGDDHSATDLGLRPARAIDK